MGLSLLITIELPNKPEIRAAVRRLVDHCYDLEDDGAATRESREAYRVIATALQTATEPENLDETKPTW